MINFIFPMGIDEIKQESLLQSSNLGKKPPIVPKPAEKKGKPKPEKLFSYF